MLESPKRARRIEACKENLVSRDEAIDFIKQLRSKVHQMPPAKPADLSIPTFKEIVAAFRALISGDLPYQAGTTTTDKPDWTQNPRHAIDRFFQALIEIFQITPPNDLPSKVKECIDHFKSENPKASDNISDIAPFTIIIEMARDIWFLETIDKQSDMLLAIKAVGGSVRRSLDTILSR